MQIGFIGLGTMGASMAANLQKAGYRLVVHDIRREAAAPHEAAGAVWASAPSRVAALGLTAAARAALAQANSAPQAVLSLLRG